MTANLSENRRQTVHMLVGGGSLLLRLLTWWQAALCAAAAAAFNAWILPRVQPALFRQGDFAAPWRSGIVIYPLAVLALILVFRDRPAVAAAAWAILAFGDGGATLVGMNVKTAALPWNRQKTLGGLAAFVLLGGAAGVAAAAWTLGAAPAAASWVLIAPLAAAILAGLAESAPLGLDDNITVPATAAAVLWSLGLMDAGTLGAAQATIASRWETALGLNAVVAALGWRAGTVTPAGAATGAIIGSAIFIGAGASGWALLLVSFLAATVATRMGYRRKVRAGIAEDRGGRRGPGNAIANTGIAAWAAGLSLGLPAPQSHLAMLAMVAALVTASSDTVASEIGKAWGRRTWLVTTFGPAPPGTPGAVSLEGTAAGIAAAALLAWFASALGLFGGRGGLPVVAAATMAALAEGALGATLERRGLLNNDALNLINSVLGAALAVAWAGAV
jgi:uncharacterized protein (TIGR00297 family)